ncbi:4-hydroxy-3-methylbut-2-enyl diphosphate reductase [Reichenbachiella versicolor]|uniref:4-hydroxy-3-methylbut-2-enyl diphosphate reductase n=1 Tax=Reichenbachiella versicolor TaxID=1821036 RepID=UPI000D6E27E0|nr:4-hydroxy-3-methylbut-2-enyl diphosphate reductase [Reichenbachiella versicolor]
MRKFDIPNKYESSIISEVKQIRKLASGKEHRKDFTPTELDFGPVRFYTARHFGFCFGVENAIETAYRIIAENPNKKIYLLSEMIHNPTVNQDLQDLGIQFIQDTKGNPYISWEKIKSEDIVIIPAFGATREIEELLKTKGIAIEKYDTTCPFVERVWKRSKSLGEKKYTVVIHGKIDHEETRATFSHAAEHGHALVIQNMEETKLLAEVINSEDPDELFEKHFGAMKNRTPGFKASQHLAKVGVVNQTTMLSTETRAIAEFIKDVLASKYVELETKQYFADTRDTLCYATSDNQASLRELLEIKADFAVVVGGYKSANTTHLVELCEEKLPTYFINGADKIIAKNEILHFNRLTKEEISSQFIPQKEKVNVLISSGASCPDAIVEQVIQRILSFFDNTKDIDIVLKNLKDELMTE